jgi:integrative and conjugative element protein (TIGR02256 family)
LRKFILKNKLKLVIEDNALSEIYKYNPEDYKYENGGILLGKFSKNDNTYIITNVSTTNSRDKKGRYYFIRNKKQAQNIINKFWNNSKGEINYLGEWHTHDENYPKTSFIDKKLVRQMINNKNIEIKNVFMIILGRNKEIYICTIDNKKETYKLEEE